MSQSKLPKKAIGGKNERDEIFAKIAQLLNNGHICEQVTKCYSNMRAKAIEKSCMNAAEMKKGGGKADLKKLEPYEEE